MAFNFNTVEVVCSNFVRPVTNSMLTTNSFHSIGVCSAD
jgi:hypothetical protein